MLNLEHQRIDMYYYWFLILILYISTQNKVQETKNYNTVNKDAKMPDKQQVIRFFTGSYNEEGAPARNTNGDGIGICSLDTQTGEVVIHGYQKQRNPRYVCVSENNMFLFAIEELPEGSGARIFSYLIEDEKIKEIDAKNIPGGYACHLTICAKHIVIANYMTGNAISIEILEAGYFSSTQQEIKNKGTGPNKLRQESAHMHMIYPWDHNQICIVDLSLDLAQGYNFEELSCKWVLDEQLSLKVERGSGARHMLMSDDKTLAFVLGELSGEITVFQKKHHDFELVQTIGTINNKDIIPAGAALKIHPNGNYIYASDRAANMISIFKINKSPKSLSLLGFQETYGLCPRDFSIDPTGCWLIVANQDSNNLVVFKLNKQSGMLTKQSSVKMETPVNVIFEHLIN